MLARKAGFLNCHNVGCPSSRYGCPTGYSFQLRTPELFGMVSKDLRIERKVRLVTKRESGMKSKLFNGLALLILGGACYGNASFADEFSKPDRTGDCRVADNRGVEKIVFKMGTDGRPIITAAVFVSIGERSRRGANASFDLDVIVNGAVVETISEDVLTSGAITCAVTCAGECPSIFGDGECISCGCVYSNWFTAAFDGLNDGDKVAVEIVAARGGFRDELRDDDVEEAVFHSSASGIPVN